ncbi:hypothetical protein D3C75_1374750 [compost metagenome]
MRERPALAADVLNVLHLDRHFLTHLSHQAILGRLAGLGKTGQGAVDPRDKTR